MTEVDLHQWLRDNFTVPAALEALLANTGHLSAEHFSFADAYVIAKTANRFYQDTELQYASATRANVEVFGFDTALQALQMYPDDEPLNLRKITSQHWGGHVFYTGDKLLVGVVMGRKRRIGWKTPPDWDGSEAMLCAYNSALEG